LLRSPIRSFRADEIHSELVKLQAMAFAFKTLLSIAPPLAVICSILKEF
jgi:uncharacterized BrkB/YihY/UPF0761 family membrane protein